MVYKWLLNSLSCLWPTHCYICQQATTQPGICTACQHDLPVVLHACRCCGLSLAGSGKDEICADCLKQAPPYDRVVSALAYTTPVSQLITGLKFHNRLHHAPLLARLLHRRLAAGPVSAQAIVPVPLHPARLRERGFNQALEIARPLAAALGIPLLRDVLIRVRETAPQSLQPAQVRRANVHQAFAVTARPVARRIALVDDVMTSGHTVSEAARCLRDSGVESVEVWCAARANSHTG